MDPHEILKQVLDHAAPHGEPRWLVVWRAACVDILAERIASSIDPVSKSLTNSFADLDAVPKRHALCFSAAASKRFAEVAADQFSVELSAAMRSQHSRQTKKEMCIKLGRVAERYLQLPAALVAIEPPRVLVFRATAARLAWTAVVLSQTQPEHAVLDCLLLASFFHSTLIGTYGQLWFALSGISTRRLFARTAMSRIVQSMSARGIEDTAPQIVSAPALPSGRVLMPRGLAAIVAEEARNVAGGNGVMHRYLLPGVALMAGSAPSEQLIAARGPVYRLYEYSVLTILALSTLEQQLRCLAHSAGVVHLKPNGRTKGVMVWVHGLGLSTTTIDSIRTVFDSDIGGIRNRAIHGSLIDIETKRAEVVHATVAAASSVAPEDPFHPANVASLCLAALAGLEKEPLIAGLTDASLAWTESFELTPDEWTFAKQVRCAFEGGAPLAAVRRLDRFGVPFCPILARFLKMAIIQLVDKKEPPSVLGIAYLLLMMEAVFRTALQVLGWPVLDLKKVGDRLIAQYLMLDSEGLMAEMAIDQLLEGSQPAEECTARRCIELAARVRNAFAHGALLRLSAEECGALSRIILQTMDHVAAGALRHMVKVAAYHRSLTPAGARERSEDNWLVAEAEFMAQLDREVADMREPRPPGAAARQ